MKFAYPVCCWRLSRGFKTIAKGNGDHVLNYEIQCATHMLIKSVMLPITSAARISPTYCDAKLFNNASAGKSCSDIAETLVLNNTVCQQKPPGYIDTLLACKRKLMKWRLAAQRCWSPEKEARLEAFVVFSSGDWRFRRPCVLYEGEVPPANAGRKMWSSQAIKT